MKQPLIFIGVAFVLAGCADPQRLTRIAVLQNQQTKQTVECRVDPWGSFDHKLQIENCIATYKKAGYVLVADSDDNKPTSK